MELISIICVYDKDKVLNENLLESLKGQTQDYELILIDNRNLKYDSLASAYNYGAKKAKGKYFIFAHQDICFSDNDWIKKTINQINKLNNIGIVGVSGKCDDYQIYSNIKYGKNSDIVSPRKLNEVKLATAIDDCLFIIPKTTFDLLNFDENSCFSWYLCATDYLLSLKKVNLNAYLIPSNLEHKSNYSTIDESYFKTIKKLQKKFFKNKVISDMLFDWKTYVPIKRQLNTKNINNSFFDYMIFEDSKNKKLKNPLKKYLNSKKISKSYLKNKIFDLSSNNYYFIFLKSKGNLKLFKRYVSQYRDIRKSYLFDEHYYLTKYKNVNNFNSDPLSHYMFVGYKKGYKPNNFMNVKYYVKKYGLNLNPITNYLEHGGKLECTNSFYKNHKLIAESGLFDETFYVNNYPEVKNSDLDMISHYMIIGFQKNYNPSENFDSKLYWETYEDVKKVNENPLLHYVRSGQYEKRYPRQYTAEESNYIMSSIDSVVKNEELTNFNKDAPLVSIIILNRNGLNYLKLLFKNFAENICYPNYEIIVVDNNSSDNSVNYLKNLSKKLPLTIIENHENKSFAEANNDAATISKGKFLLLLNNDMEPLYGWLNHMVTAFLASNDIGVVGAKLLYPFKENDLNSLKTQNEGIKFSEYNGFVNKDDGFIVPYNICNNPILESNENEMEFASVLGASLLIEKELYQKVGGLDEHLFYNFEDIDLCLKVIEEGYKIEYCPKAKIYHYYKATRDSPFKTNPINLKNYNYFYYKWNYWLAEKLFLDKLNNDLVYAENMLNLIYMSDDYKLLEEDENININNILISEDITKDNEYIIENLNWKIVPLKIKNKKYKYRKNIDILVSDIPTLNSKKFTIRNIHTVKIALIKKDINEWIQEDNIDYYDLIFTTEEYFEHFKELNNVFLLNDESIFVQIRSLLNNIHLNDKDEFNNLISNFKFEKSFDNAKEYLTILNSEYFDEKWYSEHYDVSNYEMDFITHYLKVGYKKGFNPGPNFNTDSYYLCNPDVKNSKMNPLVHYELYGKYENRKIAYSQEEIDSYNIYLSLIDSKNAEKTKKLFKTKKNQIFFYSPWDNKKDGQLNENTQMIYDFIGDKYDKLKFTLNGRPEIGDSYELLKNVLESKVIIIDQGWPLLSEVELRDDQKVINVWHACGAFKKIGYDVPIYSDNQLKRFGKQFRQYSNFIVSSPNISSIYANAHGMDKKDVLGLGVPRTDIFFNENIKQKLIDDFYKEYPDLVDKEIILFAPTFRDNYEFDTFIDWNKLSESLASNEIFVIKRHLLTKEDFLKGSEYGNIMYIEDVSLFALMFISKLLITDYSSVIFEYSLLDKPIIHYCPDFDKYTSIRDFYLDFENELFGEIIKDGNVLINKIANNDYKINISKLNKFKEKFMSACDGHATERIGNLIFKYMEE